MVYSVTAYELKFMGLPPLAMASPTHPRRLIKSSVVNASIFHEKKEPKMNHFIPILSLLLITPICSYAAETLDFEPNQAGQLPDGSTAEDNVVITDQFKSSHGVSFAVDNNLDGLPDDNQTSYRLETHYLVNPENGGTDNDTCAFWNSVPYLGRTTLRDIERAGFEGRLGDYMLTPTNRGDALLITYETPTANASGEIWDLDNSRNGDYEQVLVEAIGMDGSVVRSILSPAGGPANITNPYEGGPWVWYFAQDEAVIDRIRIRSVGTGHKVSAPLAFDNFNHNEAFVGNQPALDNAGLTSIDTSVYVPAADEWFTVAYEDLFPRRGDYDFNDLVISYRCRIDLNANGDVVQLSGEAYLRARGAGYVHDWDLRIPLANQSTALFALSPHHPMVVKLKNESRPILPGTFGSRSFVTAVNFSWPTIVNTTMVRRMPLLGSSISIAPIWCGL